MCIAKYIEVNDCRKDYAKGEAIKTNEEEKPTKDRTTNKHNFETEKLIESYNILEQIFVKIEPCLCLKVSYQPKLLLIVKTIQNSDRHTI